MNFLLRDIISSKVNNCKSRVKIEFQKRTGRKEQIQLEKTIKPKNYPFSFCTEESRWFKWKN